MKVVLPKINFNRGPAPIMNVTYTATLSVHEQTVLYLSSLLHHERLRCGTRTGRHSLAASNRPSWSSAGSSTPPG
jgi:hypothetical protein